MNLCKIQRSPKGAYSRGPDLSKLALMGAYPKMEGSLCSRRGLNRGITVALRVLCPLDIISYKLTIFSADLSHLTEFSRIPSKVCNADIVFAFFTFSRQFFTTSSPFD